MSLPNLVGCGAGKSGTTSLYHYLDEHPDIFMVPTKEIHFFSRHFEKGLPWYGDHFADQRDVRILGEFSTSYMLDPLVPQRMFQSLPDAKLLFILRNPIERAYSNYWFSLNIGTLPIGTTFSQAIRNPGGYQEFVAAGFYHGHLSRFLEYYSRDNILIILTEDFRTETKIKMKLCYDFLDVDSSFVPDLEEDYNVTLTASHQWQASVYRSWIKAKHFIRPAIIRVVPGNLKRRISVAERQIALRLANRERPPMLAKDREYLRGIYIEQNHRLSELLGRDLEIWS